MQVVAATDLRAPSKYDRLRIANDPAANAD
jgi:hypothetical protein